MWSKAFVSQDGFSYWQEAHMKKNGSVTTNMLLAEQNNTMKNNYTGNERNIKTKI